MSEQHIDYKAVVTSVAAMDPLVIGDARRYSVTVESTDPRRPMTVYFETDVRPDVDSACFVQVSAYDREATR